VRVTYELQLGLPGDWLVDQHRRAPPELAGDDLEPVLTRLQEVEINDRARPAAARLCADKPDRDRNIRGADAGSLGPIGTRPPQIPSSNSPNAVTPAASTAPRASRVETSASAPRSAVAVFLFSIFGRQPEAIREFRD
jgi:hypothetical protein